MRIFLSWSGKQSREVALALREWLPLVLQSVDPWLSDVDIGAGDRWSLEIGRNLESSNFGILCFTRENLRAPWILFEAGALAKSLSTGSVCPYLLDADFSDISGPLTQFQAKKADEKSTLELIIAINRKANSSVDERILNHRFQALWPKLQADLVKIRASIAETPPLRNSAETLEDLLTSTRSLDQRVNELLDYQTRVLSGLADIFRAEQRKLAQIFTEEFNKTRSRNVDSLEPAVSRIEISLSKISQRIEFLELRPETIEESWAAAASSQESNFYEIANSARSPQRGAPARRNLIDSFLTVLFIGTERQRPLLIAAIIFLVGALITAAIITSITLTSRHTTSKPESSAPPKTMERTAPPIDAPPIDTPPTFKRKAQDLPEELSSAIRESEDFHRMNDLYEMPEETFAAVLLGEEYANLSDTSYKYNAHYLNTALKKLQGRYGFFPDAHIGHDTEILMIALWLRIDSDQDNKNKIRILKTDKTTSLERVLLSAEKICSRDPRLSRHVIEAVAIKIGREIDKPEIPGCYRNL